MNKDTQRLEAYRREARRLSLQARYHYIRQLNYTDPSLVGYHRSQAAKYAKKASMLLEGVGIETECLVLDRRSP